MSAIIIPARLGSTRFKGKVLADIGGKPMIVRVAESCLNSKADKVVVVTDSEEVFEVCSKVDGVLVMMSPSDLATGTDRVAYAAKTIDDDVIINVQGDEPFIPSTLIDELIEELENDNTLKMVTAATQFKNLGLSENSSAVKVVLDKYSYALYFSRCAIPFDRDNSDSVVRYKHIGLYGFRREYLFEFASSDRTMLEVAENLEQLRALENGIKIKVVKTDYNPISVDTFEDLQVAIQYLKLNR